MVINPLRPDFPFTHWTTKERFRLRALESIQDPTDEEKRRIEVIRLRLYGNLQWFKKKRR